MRRGLTLILFLFAFIPFLTEAQTLTNKERRNINTRVLNLIEEYERVAPVYDDEAEYVFRNLFAGEQLPIVCDIMGFAGYLEKVTVEDYVKAVRADAASVTMEIKDVTKGEIAVSGSECTVPVKFRKSISYVDRNGYVFSTETYYQTDMFMEMSVQYDMETDRCVIVSLDGTIESEKKFPRGRFYIINKSQLYDINEKNHKYLAELRLNGSEISYNDFDQAILPSGIPTVADIDVQVLPDTLMKGPNYDVMKFDFKSRKTRLKLHYGIAPFGAYDIEASKFLSSQSRAMEAGLDIGFTWRAGKTGKMGFFFGAGASMSDLSLSLDAPLSYSYTVSELDKTTGLFKDYKLDYTLTSTSEQLKFMDIYVPVYFEIEHKVGNYLQISWNFGVKGYYNLQTEWIPYMVIGKMNEKDFVLTGGPFISASSYKRGPYDISLMGNLGFDINLAKRKVYLSIKAGYEYGLTDSYENHKNVYYDLNSRVYPVVYNVAVGQHVAVHSMITNLEYRRQAIWLQAGFKFKM